MKKQVFVTFLVVSKDTKYINEEKLILLSECWAKQDSF